MIGLEISLDHDAVMKLIRDAAVSGAIAAGEEFKAEVESNLSQHRSEETGTAELQSAEQQSGDDGVALADSIRLAVNEREVEVYVAPDKYLEGITLEYGYEAFEWGREAGFRNPDPFMRPAFDQARRSAEVAFMDEFVRALNA